MEQLGLVSGLLDNYWARSQVFRTVQFSSVVLSGILETRRPLLAEKCLRVSSAISNMRIMLRLLDDIPILVYALKNRNQSQDAVTLDKFADLVNDLCTQLYYPVEHVAWAADNQLLAVNSTKLWTVSVLLWALPLLIELIRTLKRLASVRAQLLHLRKGASSSPEQTLKLMNQQFRLLLTVVQTLCDLGLAVFWLPPGFLWAGKLTPLWWGLLGTISSIIGLYKTTKTMFKHDV